MDMIVSIQKYMRATSFYKPDHKLLETMAKELKRLRKTKGLTIEELAEICDLHSKYIQTIERGTRNISLSVFVQISRALQIAPNVLLGRILHQK